MSEEKEDSAKFAKLVACLRRVPGIESSIGAGDSDDGCWWVKFFIKIDHPLAWRVVQEFGHLLNYVSIDERLPTVFMPVSPPPYLNGGPHNYLSWVIESRKVDFQPDACAEWLEGRLPRPVTNVNAWTVVDEEEFEEIWESGWLHRAAFILKHVGRSAILFFDNLGQSITSRLWNRR
jgi:hypothetical protein